ncbi:hypothetical protein AMECASPLE_007546 [Ameca splendens]|uniref:Uncharacterized protein n=1 Tax=Ameca splendens TaxID=208324 RepID=A0ABV0Z8I1_9TELE
MLRQGHRQHALRGHRFLSASLGNKQSQKARRHGGTLLELTSWMSRHTGTVISSLPGADMSHAYNSNPEQLGAIRARMYFPFHLKHRKILFLCIYLGIMSVHTPVHSIILGELETNVINVDSYVTD